MTPSRSSRPCRPSASSACRSTTGRMRKLVDDYKTDCTRYRVVPGEGEFDLVGFVRALDAAGADVPFEVEVISR